jgi:hypothetical protein
MLKKYLGISLLFRYDTCTYVGNGVERQGHIWQFWALNNPYRHTLTEQRVCLYPIFQETVLSNNLSPFFLQKQNFQKNKKMLCKQSNSDDCR